MASVRLPRYVRKKPLAGGLTGYFWERPSWADPKHATADDPKKRALAIRHGRTCPVESEALGTDVATAIKKGDTLNDHFDDWRTGVEGRLDPGTIKALFAWYRTLDRFVDASFLTRRDYNRGMKNVEAIQLKTAKMGDLQADAITAVHADKAYKLAVKAHGKRQGALCMQVLRRVWNEAMRHEKSCPVKLTCKISPFEKMNIKMVAEKGNRDTTRTEYDLFRAKAREMGIQSMATAAAISFELVRRVSDVFGYIMEPGDELDGFFWEDYRPGVEIAMRQGKTGIMQVIPLVDEQGQPLYPELEAELARSWHEGASGHIVLHEATGKRYKNEFAAIRVFRKIRDAAGLPKKMTLTGFRHGGATELGDAGVVDIRPISGHKTLGQTLTYNKATQGKARTAGAARRAHVSKDKTR